MSQNNAVINRRRSYRSRISLRISVYYDHQNRSCSWNVGKLENRVHALQASSSGSVFFLSLSFCGSFLQLILWWTALGRSGSTPHRPHLLCWMFIASKTQTAFIESPKPALETREACLMRTATSSRTGWTSSCALQGCLESKTSFVLWTPANEDAMRDSYADWIHIVMKVEGQAANKLTAGWILCKCKE